MYPLMGYPLLERLRLWFDYIESKLRSKHILMNLLVQMNSSAIAVVEDVCEAEEKPRPPCGEDNLFTLQTRINSYTGGLKLNSSL